MQTLKNIAIYGGATPNDLTAYLPSVNHLAEILVRENITLIYGGGKIGLYGKLADSMLNLKGNVIGVMTKFLVDKEIAHTQLTRLHIVDSMHERKALMAKLADGFMMLPGGLGTFEEFFEALTSHQLGLHNKPCGILNINNYYDVLLRFLDQAATQNFIRSASRDMILVDKHPEKLLKTMKNYPGLGKSIYG